MDITGGVVTVLVVSICVGLPIFGLTLRFALKPVLEAWLAMRDTRARPTDELDGLRLRVAALEAVWERRLGAGTLDSDVPVGIERAQNHS